MRPTHNPGRVAGFWYLLLIVIGPLRLIYIPGKLFVTGNAAATVNNIAAHELLFRLGIIADLAGAVILIFLTLVFYRLFSGVDRNLAVLVVIFGGVMPALIYFVGVVSDFGVLTFVRGAGFLSVFDKPQRDALAMLFLKLRDHQNTAAEILWGGVAPTVSCARVPVALPAAVSRRVAGARRLRLPCLKCFRRAVAAISGQGIYDFPACLLRGDSPHAVVGDQRCQAGTGRSLIVRRCLAVRDSETRLLS
jgi:Domain of unknown function (DUF4386)